MITISLVGEANLTSALLIQLLLTKSMYIYIRRLSNHVAKEIYKFSNVSSEDVQRLTPFCL